MKKALFMGLVFALAISAQASPITFNTFVQSSDINALLGQTNTIGFTYAGNKFVGSVYFGGNNAQLYSTDLNGQNLQKFSTPIPGAAGEVVLGSALNAGGFSAGDIYTGSEVNGQIYKISNSGGAPTLFATVPVGNIRGIQFDTGGAFGGDMLVTTNAGRIYRVSSTGVVSLVANVGEDTEGMDIAGSAWGPYQGQLLVSSENSGLLRLIKADGTVTVVNPNDRIGSAETVSFVPLDLGQSGNPLEGFYVANYPVNVQKADASQFLSFLGDAIITSEDGANSRLWLAHYDSGTNSFSVSLLSGTLPNQSEDGIFVTAQRIQQTQVPEPASLILLGSGLLGLGGKLRRRITK